MARIIHGNKANIVGQQVKLYRKKCGFSQQKLSEKLETLEVYVCRGSVSRIEDGTRSVTDIELYAIAAVLEIPICELFPK